MQPGIYRVRSEWSPRSIGDRVLAGAVIEVEDGGTVFVHLNGEPMFAFAHPEAFFGAHSVSLHDLESCAAAG